METGKQQLRKEMLQRRGSLSLGQAVFKSGKIMLKVMGMNKFKSSNIIMCYIDFRNEVHTRAFIKRCIKLGKRVAVPVVLPLENGSKVMIASEIHDIEKDTEKGCFGILEPKKQLMRQVKPEELDMVIVPGSAFDEKLNRLGYGAGFYDRFLRNTRDDCLKVGAAFELQICNDVPTDVFDVPMDMVVTENRLIMRESTFINTFERVFDGK